MKFSVNVFSICTALNVTKLNLLGDKPTNVMGSICQKHSSFFVIAMPQMLTCTLLLGNIHLPTYTPTYPT